MASLKDTVITGELEIFGDMAVSNNVNIGNGLEVSGEITADKVSTVNIDTSGNISSAGVSCSGSVNAKYFNATSKRSSKKNIEKYEEDALSKIKEIEIVSFEFIEDESKEKKIGFIADDTDSIFSGPNKDKMDITNSVGLLLKAVQELQQKNEELEKRIERLEKR